MLTAITAISTQAQVTMKYSAAGQVPGSYDSVLTSSTNTYYFLTPVNALNAGVSGQYQISFSYTVLTTLTFKAIIQCRMTTNTSDSGWVNVHRVVGTDGRNCDTLQVTSAAYGTPGGWIFNASKGAIHTEKVNVATANNTSIGYSSAGRAMQFRLVIINASGTGIIRNVRTTVQL